MARVFLCGASCNTIDFPQAAFGASKVHWDYLQGDIAIVGSPIDPPGALGNYAAWAFDISAAPLLLKEFNTTSGLAQLSASARFRVDSSPALDAPVSIVFFTPATANAAWVQIDSTGAVSLGYHTDAGATVNTVAITTVSLDAYHTLDLAVNATANPWSISAKIDGGSTVSASPANAADAFNVVLGDASGNGAGVGSMYVTHLVVDDTYAAYPIGQKIVRGFNVNATSGTHVQTAGDLKNNSAANVTSGDSSGSLVTEVPAVATDYVAQTVLRTTTYWEGIYNTASETQKPNAVEQISSFVMASAASGTHKFQLYDGTSAADGIATTAWTNIGIGNLTKCWAAAPSTGAWTLAKFQALRIRWGFSGDVTPNPRLVSTWLEAEFDLPVSAANPFPYPGAGYYGG